MTHPVRALLRTPRLLRSLASLMVLAVVGTGIYAQSSRPTAKPAAIVNGTAITMAEVESILKQAGLQE